MNMPVMVFRRDYQAYTGGHAKVRDYMDHVLSAGWDVRLYLQPGSRRHPGDPWEGLESSFMPEWSLAGVDAVFVAGQDWRAMGAHPPGIPVVNLIQGLRHADPGSELRGYLHRPAMRVCVSAAVADALEATGEVCGPVHVIPAALNLPADPGGAAQRKGVLIDGSKRPELAAMAAGHLAASGLEVRCLLEPLPRRDYLHALARAEVVVALPLEREGFYLPALEAMALGAAVVTLDAGGNRGYLQHMGNAWVAPADPASVAAAVLALHADTGLRMRMVDAGRHCACAHTLARERDMFVPLLMDMETSWNDIPVTSH